MKTLFSNLNYKRTLTFLGVILLIATVPITVFIAQRQQELRQQAALIGTPVIASDAVSTSNAGSVSSLSWNHTTGSLPNLILIVGISLASNTVSVSSVTYDGIALTKLARSACSANFCSNEMWYLLAPPGGIHQVIVSLTGTTNIVGGAVTYYNVSQTNPLGTAVTGSGSSNFASVIVLSNTGQLVVDTLAGGGQGSWTPSLGQTQLWSNNNFNFGSGSSKPGSPIMSWTNTVSDVWSEIAVPINPSALNTITPTPTILPTNTPVPTPTSTPIPPTNAPTPTPTPIPGSTQLAFTILLHGIGNGGDNANPNGGGNPNPLHPQRTLTVSLFNASNVLAATNQGSITYDAASGSFKGTIDMGTTLTSGIYTIKVKSTQYLTRLVPGFQQITSGQINTVPSVRLVAGDINGDNQLDILDYNILLNCYSDFQPPISCTTAQKLLSDLDDDGNVNATDYNLFLRELSVQSGN